MTWQLPIGAQVTPQGVQFRVWAPAAERVDVVLFDGDKRTASHGLSQSEGGYWQAEVSGIGAGARYAYSVNGDEPRPDPASRWQPDGVHAPSAVVDPQAFRWNDGDWRGIPLDDLIIYEVHVGTATTAGTFDALIEKLPYFVELGVTALEIMPISDFPGTRNWGYDGVDLYAPANAYGGPEAFKRLVDAAHQHNLAIILDVVYNHFGPDGNYLRVYSPQYFTDRHHTPWGDALNLDGPGAEAVRSFFVNNALYWAHEYHIDGLRLDATHALIDDSPIHLLQELTSTVRASLPIERHFVITAEDERNDARLGTPVAEGGYGLDAIWADDFHHEARIGLTGEQTGYYADYSGSINDLAKTIHDGWFYQGQRSSVSKHNRGTPPHPLRPAQFVYCIQNHDQIGNRPLGDRLNHTIDIAAYRALSALLLLVPQTPLLFQGQEWAASTPYLYFTDHNPELGRLVTEGRRKEFESFWRETHMEVPDPQAVETFERSKLNWDERSEDQHAAMLALYRDLIALRRKQAALQRQDRGGYAVEVLNDKALTIRRHGQSNDDGLLIVVNLGAASSLTISDPTIEGSGSQIMLDTNDARYGGAVPAQLAKQANNDVVLQMSNPGVVIIGNP